MTLTRVATRTIERLGHVVSTLVQLLRAIGSKAWSAVRRSSGPVKLGLAFTAGAFVTAIANIAVPYVADRLTADETPFRIVIETNPDRIQRDGVVVGGSYVVRRPIEEIGEPPDGADTCAGRHDWATALGGVAADTSTGRIRIEATEEGRPVNITGFEARLVSREEPIEGVHLGCPGRGDPLTAHSVTVDLANDPATVAVTDSDGTPTRDVHFVVNHGSPEAFDLTALAPTCDCTWRLVVHLEVDGKDATQVVDNDGDPFRVTSSRSSSTYRWWDGHWEELSATGPAVPPPTPGNCPLADLQDVESVAGTGWQAQPVEKQVGPGEDTTTICTFVPANGSPGYISISLTATQDVPQAVDLFDGLATGYRTYDVASPVPDLDDVALLFSDTILIQRGANVLVVTAEGTDKPQDVALAIGQLAAEREW